jgi:hypothetical protein
MGPLAPDQSKAPVAGATAGNACPRRHWKLASGALPSLFGTTTVFGTPGDIALSELALEAFYPADPMTARVFNRIAGTCAAEERASVAANW